MATYPIWVPNLASRHETRDDLSSLEEADTSYPEDGEQITKWADSTGSNDFTATSNWPLYQTGDPNSQGRVECSDASIRRMRQENRNPLDTAIGNATDHTTILAYRLTNPTNDTAGDVYEEETGGIKVVNTAGNALTVGGPKATITAQATADGDWHILSTDVQVANGKMNAYLDGTQVGVETDCTDTMSSPLINYQIAFTAPGDVDFVAVIIYNRRLSAFERQEVEYYLDQQYGLGLGLSNPHATFPSVAGAVSRWETRGDLDTVEEADTSYPEDGEAVIKWNDLTGSNDMDTTNNPVFEDGANADAPNSQGSIYLQRSNTPHLDTINNAPLDSPISVPMTMYVVGKFDDPGNVRVDRLVTLDEKIINVLAYDDPAEIQVSGNGTDIQLIANASLDTNYHLYTVQAHTFAAGALKANAWVDGVSKGQDVALWSSGAAETCTEINIGRRDGSQGLDGNICALLLYSGLHTALQRQKVEYYLDQEYFGGSIGIAPPNLGISTGVGIFPHDG
jgi:hypothetical protein